MTPQSTEIATRDPVRELVAQVRSDTFKEQVQLALPESVGPDRFVRATVTALMQNPDLATAEPDSVFQSVIRCAQDGLMPDGNEAALVIYKTKVGNQWVPKAQYLPMIGGFRKIAAEHGWSLRTRVVYANDEFEHQFGVNENVFHVPTRPGEERGRMFAAYAIGAHKDGRVELEVMYQEDIAKVRASSKTSERGPWADWEERMWEKTVGRRLFKKLPLDEKDRERVTRVLDAAELPPGEAARLMYGPDVVNTATGELEGAKDQPDSPRADGDGPAEPAEGGAPLPASDANQQADGSEGPSPEPSAPGPEEAPPGEPDADKPQGFSGPAEAANAPHVLAAQQAAEVLVPAGKYAGARLREVLDKEGGEGWLRWCLSSWQTEPFRTSVWEFARVFATDLYTEVLAQKEAAA